MFLLSESEFGIVKIIFKSFISSKTDNKHLNAFFDDVFSNVTG